MKMRGWVLGLVAAEALAAGTAAWGDVYVQEGELQSITEEEWAQFLGHLDGGTVRQREESLEDGDAGPWMYLYWQGDRGVEQEFAFASRADLTAFEAYCEEKGLNPVIDHTNNEDIYTRNKIRLNLIPQLQEYNENILQGLVRLGHIAADDKDYFWQETEKAFAVLQVKQEYTALQVKADEETAGKEKNQSAAEQKGADSQPAAAKQSTSDQPTGRAVILDRAGLADLHPAIRHRVVQKAFGIVGLEKDITAERLAAADAIILKKQGPKTVEFPHGYRITVAKGRVILTRA